MISRWYVGDLKNKIEALCMQTITPLGVALGWIEEESGGRITEVTTRDERGYFQLDPAESADLGLTPKDHIRLSIDPEWSLQIGFKLVAHHHGIVISTRVPDLMSDPLVMRPIVVNPCSEYAWRLTKFSHSIGPGDCRRIMMDAARQFPPMSIDWPTLSTWCKMQQGQYAQSTDDGGLGHDPVKWVEFVNRVFNVGHPYGTGNV